MQTLFDLIRRDPDGSFVWLEAVADLARARARLQELASRNPGEYLLFDHTRQETVEKVNRSDAGSWKSNGRYDPRFIKTK